MFAYTCVNAGKFVTVKGTVVRVSCIKPLCVRMAYECINCRHIQVAAWLSVHCVLLTHCVRLAVTEVNCCRAWLALGWTIVDRRGNHFVI